MRNLGPRRRRWVRVRVTLLGALLGVAALLVGRRAYELQVARAPSLREMAESQYLRNIRLAPKRGTIYDRHGAELAVSVEVESVWANPRALRAAGVSSREVAERLARTLPVELDRIRARLDKDRYFVWIKRHVTPQQASAVRALKLPGVHMSDESRRYYPNRELLAHVLGFANIDGKGIEGLELALEEVLRGSVREVPAIRDRRGAVVFSEQLLDDQAAQGHDVVLTIDKTIQHIAERELALAVQTFEAASGDVVVLDPRTGEMLALANYPAFNPNDPGRVPAAYRRNRAVTDRFEPGSTVKPFTVAAALGAGTIHPEQRIDCEDGAMQVAEYTIHDSHRFEELTPAQILAFSSNIGTAKIGETLGRRGLYRAMRRFGFGSTSGLPLPGETEGILRHYRRWYDMDAATISFGQGMSVTSVQLAVAMGALANEGRLMAPTLIRRVQNGHGETVEENLPRVRRQVVPRWAARMVSDMLVAVTGPDGTGTEAAIEGHLVAGKTGTAQKADYVHGGYAKNKWVASFAGFVPARDPRLVIAVTIDEPVIAHAGGTVAAPVFRRVGEAALRHLGIPADAGGAAIAHLRARARVASSRADPEGSPEVKEGSPERPVDDRSPGAGETRVPDVMGKSARAALVALHEAKLEVMIEGSGTVTTQIPGPFAILQEGASVQIVLEPRVDAPVPGETGPPEGDALAMAMSPASHEEVPR